MKRIFVSLSLILAVGFTTVPANDETDVNDKVKESFKKEFVGAKSINWSHAGDYQIALFVFNGHRVEAFFNTDGELEGSCRDILFTELPLAVAISLNKHFAVDDFIDILEVSNTDGTSYFVTVETPQNKLYRVKADPHGKILSKVKKKEL